MATLIIIFIVLGLALLILPFAKDLMKDKNDLRTSPIEKRFDVLIAEINKAFLDGRGKTCYPDKNDNRLLNLHSEDRANYLIQFYYSTGHLTIYLNYLYFHKELNEKVPFYNVRHVDSFTQKRMANEFIQKMRIAISKHQQTIGIPSQTGTIPSSVGDLDSMIESDSTSVVCSAYGKLSVHQRKSVINMGYQIFSANGSSWNDFIKTGSTREVLNYMNLNWEDCKKQLDTEGEDSIYSDLTNLDSGIYDMILMFWLDMLATKSGSNEARAVKFIEMNQRLGHSESDINARIQKIQLISKTFGI